MTQKALVRGCKMWFIAYVIRNGSSVDGPGAWPENAKVP
jgi:hypothetical protein